MSEPINESIKWDEIEAFAGEQGLAAIILDGIEKLPEHLRPSKDNMLQWIGNVIQVFESKYVDYEKAIGELTGFYNQDGIMMKDID